MPANRVGDDLADVAHKLLPAICSRRIEFFLSVVRTFGNLGFCIDQWVLSLIHFKPITRCSASARAARTLICVCWTETSI